MNRIDAALRGLLCLFFLLSAGRPAAAEEFTPLRGVYHVHSDYSCGKDSMRDIVLDARKRGLDFIIFSDHDQGVAEYSAPPLRKLVRMRQRKNYKIDHRLDAYFAEAAALNEEFPDILVAAGLEINPHYYWTGDPLRGLSVHGLNRHVVVMDLPDAAAYRRLPGLHKPEAARYQPALLPPFLLALGFVGLALFNVSRVRCFTRKGWRWPLLFIAVLVASNQLPYASSAYSQFDDWGPGPYQEFLDGVKREGGIAVWAHMEGKADWDNLKNVYGVEFAVEDYADMLQTTRGAQGFALLYGDITTMQHPGRGWDRHLLDYVTGRRAEVSFGLGEVDYNGVSSDLDFVQTIALVRERSVKGVFDAIRHGRCHSARFTNAGLLMPDFECVNTTTGKRTQVGGDATVDGPPTFDIRVKNNAGMRGPARVRIVKNGEVVYDKKLELPIQLTWTDEAGGGEPAFYRVIAGGVKYDEAMTNPIFCNRVGAK